jgi:hypothetical protein
VANGDLVTGPKALDASALPEMPRLIIVTRSTFPDLAFDEPTAIMEWAPSRRVDVASKGQLGN